MNKGDIEIDGNVYKLCGHAYKSGTHTIYLVKDMFFEECEDSNNEICRGIVKWADDKYYKQLKYGWLKKLERKNKELERKNKELKIELHKVISIIKELQNIQLTNCKADEYYIRQYDTDITVKIKFEKCIGFIYGGNRKSKSNKRKKYI